MENFNINP